MSSSPATADGPPGVSLTALASWLDREHPGLRAGDLSAQAIAGGRSNLTYRVDDGATNWVLRRPPLGHVLPTAHDMAREFTVLTALHPSPVPVPEPVVLCADRSVLGEPFYLMSFVDGVVVDSPDLVADPVTARGTTTALVDTLLTLHGVDPASVGLADFGRPEGFLQRQIRRWHKQFESSVAEPDPTEGKVAAVLAERAPQSSRTSIVHGDYRLTNVIYRFDLSSIAAVVDWEMATLGDPLTDLGLLFVYHDQARANFGVMPDFPAAQGFLSPEQMLERYFAATGADSADIDWYISFGFFKLGVIAAGIDARYQQGKTVGEGFDVFGAIRDESFASARSRLAAL